MHSNAAYMADQDDNEDDSYSKKITSIKFIIHYYHIIYLST